MENPMTDLNHEARQLVRLGRGLGEPSDADVARVRSSLMRRVGVATTVVAAGSVVSKAATAARVAFLGSSMVTKVVAVTALVSAGVAGGVAYQTRASRSSTEQPAQSAPAIHRPAVAARKAAAEGPRATPSATLTEEIAERAVAPPIAPAAPLVRRTEAAPLVPVPPVREHAEQAAAATSSGLSEDVAALREAQAALLAGHPQQALDVGARVRADGPLAAEREGLLLVAQCTLGAPGAPGQARDFAQHHAGSPLALRVQRACKLDGDDFQTKRAGDGHP
jgi:hypothetical protein